MKKFGIKRMTSIKFPRLNKKSMFVLHFKERENAEME